MKRLGIIALIALVSMAASGQAHAGSLWASESYGGQRSDLFELDSTTGAVLSVIPGPGTFADALSFTNDGQNIWVLDSSTNSTVYRIDLAGNVLQQFNVALDAEGLSVLADNSLLIGGGNSGTIAYVNPADGSIISQFTPAGQTFGIATNGNDRIYGLRINGVIDTYDLVGNHLGSLTTAVQGTTLGLAFAGNSFFVARTGSTIYEVALDGSILNSFSGPGSFTEGLDFPVGVQVPDREVPLPAAAWIGLITAAGFAARRRKAAIVG